MAEIQAVPVRWMRTVEDIQNIRGERAQAAQDARMVEALPGAAAMTKAAAAAEAQ